MKPETISALVLGCGAIITSLGVCIRRIHLRHVKMRSCCGDMSIDMQNSRKTSIDDRESDVENQNNSTITVNDEHKDTAVYQSRQAKQ